MATFKTRAFRTSKLKENKIIEKRLRKSGRFDSKPMIFSSVKSNILFEKLLEVFKLNFNSNDNIKGKEQEINSVVENGSVYTITTSPSFVISIGGSWLRITPNKFQGLHISRLEVVEFMRGMGIGSLLLSTFSKLLLKSICKLMEDDINYLNNLPIIDLEVLNYVGNGVKVDVDRTVSLYEKFGFSVVENRHNYKRMEMNIIEMVNNLKVLN